MIVEYKELEKVEIKSLQKIARGCYNKYCIGGVHYTIPLEVAQCVQYGEERTTAIIHDLKAHIAKLETGCEVLGAEGKRLVIELDAVYEILIKLRLENEELEKENGSLKNTIVGLQKQFAEVRKIFGLNGTKS
jgi:hypothetical protein